MQKHHYRWKGRSSAVFFCRNNLKITSSSLLWPLVYRCDSAGCGSLGESQLGGLFLPYLWGHHQRTVRPDRHRSHHRYFWTVWLLRHMPRKPMDAETGRGGDWRKPPFRSLLWDNCASPVFQYAMFLTLVFLAELVAGVSGFIFRHEVMHENISFFIF